MSDTPYMLKRLADVTPTPCPCGSSRRMFTQADGVPVGIHRLSVDGAATPHYHTKLTEYYVFLEGTGTLELDGESVPVGPGDVVMIPPGTVHAANGRFELMVVVSPPFDPEDEHLVEAGGGSSAADNT